MRKLFAFLFGISIPLLLGASYGIFSPGGALSGTWNSQNVNVGAGSPFVTGLLPAANFGTGTATGAIDWSATQTYSKAFSSGNVGAINVASSSPRIEVSTTSASSNEGVWAAVGGNSTLSICALNDARTTSNCPLIFNRSSGTTVSNGQWFVRILGTTATLATSATDTLLVGTSAQIINMTLAQFNGTGGIVPIAAASDATGSETFTSWNKATSGDNLFINFGTEGTFTNRGTITYNRGSGLVSYNVTSSRNLKQNIRDSGPSGLIIDAIRVRDYEFSESGNTVRHWLIAEELQQVMPLASDGQNVDVSKVVPLLIKEIQSLRLRVMDLEASSFNARSAANEDSLDSSHRYSNHRNRNDDARDVVRVR